MNRKRILRTCAPLVALTLTAAACGSSGGSKSSGPSKTSSSTGAAGTMKATDSSESAASTLRATLTSLLTEHVYLASQATGAALRGDQATYDATVQALNGETDSNTTDLVGAVTSAYGPEVGKAFDGLWRSDKHIPAFVAYTQAAAKDDEAGKQAAVADLTGYAKTFGETMHSVNANLSADAVAQDITMHATTLLKVIDAQKAGDQAGVYTALEAAYTHMADTAKTLAVATAQKFPKKFPGDATSKAADLRAGLTALLEAHVWLAGDATAAALGGRQAQFDAAANALNGPTNSNTSELVDAVGSIYGDQVKTAFDGLWRSQKHIPAFVAYTQAAAKDDEAGKQAAVADLTGYAKTFGETMHSVNSNLPADAVAQDITMHATTLIAAIDAQKAGSADAPKLLRTAVAHMAGTAEVLAAATEKKFPDTF